jgi:hypothetical protein
MFLSEVVSSSKKDCLETGMALLAMKFCNYFLVNFTFQTKQM